MGILMSSSTVPSFWHLRKLLFSASEWQSWNSNPDNSLFYFLMERITRTTGKRLLTLLKLWRLPHLSWIMENLPSYNPDHFLFCTLMRKIREKVLCSLTGIYSWDLYDKAKVLHLIFHSRYPGSSSFTMIFFLICDSFKGMSLSKCSSLTHTHSISPEN